MLPGQKKNGQSSFGYKNHISVDVEYGFIRRYQFTDASVHDSQVLGAVLNVRNQGEQELWTDSTYGSESIEWILQILQFLSHIHEQAYRNHPLTAKQKFISPHKDCGTYPKSWLSNDLHIYKAFINKITLRVLSLQL
ncbi:MAG: transposase [Richelia sp.]|nr:transposase [Richelia sp.]